MTRPAAHRRSSRTTSRHGPPQLRLGVWRSGELVVDNFAGCSVCPPLAEAIVRANYSEREAVAA